MKTGEKLRNIDSSQKLNLFLTVSWQGDHNVLFWSRIGQIQNKLKHLALSVQIESLVVDIKPFRMQKQKKSQKLQVLLSSTINECYLTTVSVLGREEGYLAITYRKSRLEF